MKKSWFIIALMACTIALQAEEGQGTHMSTSSTAKRDMHREGMTKEQMEARREKWQEKKKEMQEKRTERREQALERINKHLAKIDEREKELGERRAKLMEMKHRIESAPAGSDVEYNDIMPWHDGKVKIQENK